MVILRRGHYYYGGFQGFILLGLAFGKRFVIEKVDSNAWCVYLVRTEHDKLYCGISNDPIARFYKHCNGSGAKFFASSKPIALVYIEPCESRSQALKREYAIKQFSKNKKEQLIANSSQLYKLPLYNDKNNICPKMNE